MNLPQAILKAESAIGALGPKADRSWGVVTLVGLSIMFVSAFFILQPCVKYLILCIGVMLVLISMLQLVLERNKVSLRPRYLVLSFSLCALLALVGIGYCAWEMRPPTSFLDRWGYDPVSRIASVGLIPANGRQYAGQAILFVVHRRVANSGMPLLISCTKNITWSDSEGTSEIQMCCSPESMKELSLGDWLTFEVYSCNPDFDIQRLKTEDDVAKSKDIYRIETREKMSAIVSATDKEFELLFESLDAGTRSAVLKTLIAKQADGSSRSFEPQTRPPDQVP